VTTRIIRTHGDVAGLATFLGGRKLPVTVTITAGAKRSDAQNRLLHACLSEISKQVEWAGAKRDVDTWKRLLTAAWLRARGEPIEMLPALDGNGVDIVFRKTSQLSKAECAELSEFVMAWAAERGIYMPAPEGCQ
jgi:hypothetical protein